MIENSPFQHSWGSNVFKKGWNSFVSLSPFVRNNKQIEIESTEPQDADLCPLLYFQCIPGELDMCILRCAISLAGDFGLLWLTVGRVFVCVSCPGKCWKCISFLYPRKVQTVIRLRIFPQSAAVGESPSAFACFLVLLYNILPSLYIQCPASMCTFLCVVLVGKLWRSTRMSPE